MKRILIYLTLLLAAAPGVRAQNPSEYRVPADPMHWVSDNAFRMYLIRNGDTVGDPARAVSVFKETWASHPQGFQVVRASSDVGLIPRVETDTSVITRRGRVLSINGLTEYPKGEWDAFPRLPAVPLRVGVEWSDTISQSTASAGIDGLYAVVRRYRVTRNVTTPDSAGLEIISTGRVRFRTSFWMDSAAGSYRWVALEGPTQDTIVFDAAAGRLRSWRWSMDLTGTGGDFAAGKSDTVPAGLKSSNTRYTIPAARATALTAPLPGSDSSVTIYGGSQALFRHTLDVSNGLVSEGFRRADGFTGTAVSSSPDGKTVHWVITWVGPDSDPRTTTFDVSDGTLRGEAGTLEAPTTDWAIAEYGMAGMMIQPLQRLEDGADQPFSVYRPTPAKWDTLMVTKRSFPDFRIYVLRSSDGDETAMLVSSDGTLLYEETTKGDAAGSARIPTITSHQEALQRALATLQAGQ